MLARTSHQPDEMIGRMRGTAHGVGWAFTVEKVAVNAVMAGARPDYFPVILALAASGRTARGTSTSSSAAMVVVNGPVRHEIGMNAGMARWARTTTPMPPLDAPTACCRRTWRVGSIPGRQLHGLTGQRVLVHEPDVAENEEDSPWDPFHVAQGFSRETSTVSMFGFCWHTAFAQWPARAVLEAQVQRMLQGMDARSRILFVLDPVTARTLRRAASTRVKSCWTGPGKPRRFRLANTGITS